MNEVSGAIIGVVVAALLLFQFAEGIASVVAALIVSATRWVQKHCFGIDRPRVGADALEGIRVQAHEGFSVSDESGLLEGYVLLEGERWRARIIDGSQGPESGSSLSVVKREGLILLVSQVAGK